eukprot:TRINITY_DN39878_c0_g1_i1.p1 TRINITY_DN39878_c0_g1~~TRINITY_DN39878_c0_g1_i1.p1  ORF type:complete len:524 (+),score=122.94 TRINITY_DN39878_c0_g1_i1:45-1616(+)
MRVRSATYFFPASSKSDAISGMKDASKALAQAKKALQDAGYEVQTVRAATNSFEEYLSGNTQDMLASLQEVEAAADGVDFVSVGSAERRLDVMEAALSGHTSKTFFEAPLRLCPSGVPDHEAALRVAEVVCRLGALAPAKTSDVPSVFRMTVTGNLDPGAPYFPGGYWTKGKQPALALALEDSGILVEAFKGAKSLEEAQRALEKAFTKVVVPLEEVAKKAAQQVGVDYGGMDCSIASSSKAEESLVSAYESLDVGPFGGAGTLSISAIITAVLKRLPVSRCGYSGLMLPVTEDFGLAKCGNEGRLSIQQLLFYSAVCGTGIDTVPVEGSTDPARLAMVYMDMASLAFRLKKPLSARLWPVAGKKAGDLTEVNNPFFVNTKVMKVDPTSAAAGVAGQHQLADAAGAHPMAHFEAAGGLDGDVELLSNSAQAVVLKLKEGCNTLAVIVQNVGPSAWPAGTYLQLVASQNPESADLQQGFLVPEALSGEKVTVMLAFAGHGGNKTSQYRLRAGDAEFGPLLILVD